jgi:hypothetical protein
VLNAQFHGEATAEQDDILVEVGGIVISERSTDAEAVHDFHGLCIFHLLFAGDGMPRPVRSELPRITEVMTSAFSFDPVPM